MNMTNEIVEMIESGDVDGAGLKMISDAITERRIALGMGTGVPYCIKEGQFDLDLAKIRNAVQERSAILGGQERAEEKQQENMRRYWKRNDKVRVKTDSPIRPKYLLGLEFTVVRTNRTTVTVSAPNEPQYRRYAGHQNIRMPIDCMESV